MQPALRPGPGSRHSGSLHARARAEPSLQAAAHVLAQSSLRRRLGFWASRWRRRAHILCRRGWRCGRRLRRRRSQPAVYRWRAGSTLRWRRSAPRWSAGGARALFGSLRSALRRRGLRLHRGLPLQALRAGWASGALWRGRSALRVPAGSLRALRGSQRSSLRLRGLQLSTQPAVHLWRASRAFGLGCLRRLARSTRTDQIILRRLIRRAALLGRFAQLAAHFRRAGGGLFRSSSALRGRVCIARTLHSGLRHALGLRWLNLRDRLLQPAVHLWRPGSGLRRCRSRLCRPAHSCQAISDSRKLRLCGRRLRRRPLQPSSQLGRCSRQLYFRHSAHRRVCSARPLCSSRSLALRLGRPRRRGRLAQPAVHPARLTDRLWRSRCELRRPIRSARALRSSRRFALALCRLWPCAKLHSSTQKLALGLGGPRRRGRHAQPAVYPVRGTGGLRRSRCKLRRRVCSARALRSTQKLALGLGGPRRRGRHAQPAVHPVRGTGGLRRSRSELRRPVRSARALRGSRRCALALCKHWRCAKLAGSRWLLVCRPGRACRRPWGPRLGRGPLCCSCSPFRRSAPVQHALALCYRRACLRTPSRACLLTSLRLCRRRRRGWAHGPALGAKQCGALQLLNMSRLLLKSRFRVQAAGLVHQPQPCCLAGPLSARAAGARVGIAVHMAAWPQLLLACRHGLGQPALPCARAA